MEKINIVAKAPLRISFAGGGSDLPSYIKHHGGEVFVSTINQWVTVTLKAIPHMKEGIKVSLVSYNQKKFLHTDALSFYQQDHFDIIKAACNLVKVTKQIEIIITSNIPPASGLGTSSATALAILAALYKYKKIRLNKPALAKDAVHIERSILKIAGGIQDQYAISFGGFNYINFIKNGQVCVKSVELKQDIVKRLEENLLLFYLEGDRSGENQQNRLNRFIIRSDSTVEALGQLRKICKIMQSLLVSGNLDEFAKYLHKSWLLKKKTSTGISTDKIDKIYNQSLQCGAVGGKILGAGGGGCLLLYCPINKQKAVCDIFTQIVAQQRQMVGSFC